jgi:hypothetical protein
MGVGRFSAIWSSRAPARADRRDFSGLGRRANGNAPPVPLVCHSLVPTCSAETAIGLWELGQESTPLAKALCQQSEAFQNAAHHHPHFMTIVHRLRDLGNRGVEEALENF